MGADVLALLDGSPILDKVTFFRMEVMRIERWGKSWRFFSFKGRKFTTPKARDEPKARYVPKVHKVQHFADEGEYIMYKLDEVERKEHERFSSSLVRARSRVRELALCNDWDFFVTLTLNKEKQDRFNLQKWVKDLGNWIGNYNKRFGAKLRYILIPELHEDGAWHAHGLMHGLAPHSLCINEHGYLDCPYYRNRFGFISLSRVKSHERVASYITKYITKDQAETCRSIGGGKHLFYASRGLQGREIVWQGWGSFSGGYESPYCKSKWVSAEDALWKLQGVVKGVARYGEEVLNIRSGQGHIDNACVDRDSGGGEVSERPRAIRDGTGYVAPTGTETDRPTGQSSLCGGRQNNTQQLTECQQRDKVAYSVSSPRRSYILDDIHDDLAEQLTFFGM